MTFAALLAASTLSLTAANTQVVVAPDAPPAVRFAASEMRTFLSRVFGADIREVPSAEPGFCGIHLGESAALSRARLTTKSLGRDAFILAVKGGHVYIAGRDDPKIDPGERVRRAWWASHKFEHATLYGVYTFLERAAGVRFYFADELGTCVPRRDVLRLPAGEKVVAPDMAIRTWSYFTDGKWPVPLKDPKYSCPAEKALNVYRLKSSTAGYSCCHGLNGFRLIDRFKDSHPEYFALLKDGSRADHVINGQHDVGHLCFNTLIT